MPGSPNKLSQFWNELKRRRVIHVIIVYATATLVIIDLINNVTEPLRLPEWTPTFVIIILLVLFPLAVIFSWIFDVTPEGIEKTKPAAELQNNQKTTTPNSWRIATYVSGAVIVGLIILNILPGRKNNAVAEGIYDNSIALLQFVNNSPDTGNTYIINGYRAAIHDKLCHLEDLRVLALSSAEQYRNLQTSFSEIANEMHVRYLLSANGQVYGNHIRLIVQLIDANGEVVWSHPYDRIISTVYTHIEIQSDIAQNVAQQIGVIVTPDERQLMDKIPTTNVTAYNLILQAQKYFNQYTLTKNRDYLEKVSQVCNVALDMDPGFALAYYWLGKSALSEKNEDYMMGSLKPFYLDTALFFFNRALELDPALPEAYAERGIYYSEQAQRQKALEDLQRAISISPNNPTAYLNSASVYSYSRDFINALINLRKAERLIRSDEMLFPLYRDLLFVYASVWDWNKLKLFISKMTQIAPQYGLVFEMHLLQVKGNNIELLQAAEQYIDLYPEKKSGYSFKATSLINLGRKQEAEDCIRAMLEFADPDVNNAHRVGFIFWMNGKRDKAMEYFNMQIDYCLESIQSHNPFGQTHAAYDLAGVHAFLGHKEEAISWLREYEKMGFMSGMHEMIKIDPLFDKIRDDETFKGIVSRASEKAAALRAEMQEMEEY